MKATALACLLLTLVGCASHSNAVRCDGRLQPINTPASASAPEGASTRASNIAPERNRE
jgi:hypothetical protein